MLLKLLFICKGNVIFTWTGLFVLVLLLKLLFICKGNVILHGLVYLLQFCYLSSYSSVKEMSFYMDWFICCSSVT